MSDCHSNDRSCRRSAMASRVEARRYRDKAHIKFVASRSCLVCERKPCDPHRLRFAQVRALGRKVSDEFTVPLCRLHHRELHRSRNEPLWWKNWASTRSRSPPSSGIGPGPFIRLRRERR